jgi:crotonyl-CoA reductase
VAVLALAEAPGLGVTNPELRAKHIDAINRFRQD